MGDYTYYQLQNQPSEATIPPVTFDPNYELPPHFFAAPVPEGYRAIFSTMDGKKKMRKVKNTRWIYSRPIWESSKILEFCNEIRARFHAHCKNIQPLHNWVDLYTYFDQFDIYTYGAWNLWTVIHHLISQNRVLVEELKEEASLHFESWIVKLLQDGGCRKRLSTWIQDFQHDILNCLEGRELRELGGIDYWYLPAIRHILWNYHTKLNDRPGWVPNHAELFSCSNANTPQVKDLKQASKCTRFSIYIQISDWLTTKQRRATLLSKGPRGLSIRRTRMSIRLSMVF